jgi:hypothetical protein
VNIDDTNGVIGLIVGLIAIIGALVAWLRWVRPKIHRGRKEIVAVRDAILGRDAITDSVTGTEIAPALPGMGVRMAHQEKQMELLTTAVAQIADSHQRLESLETRVQALENASVERVVTRAESAQAWRAIAAVHESNGDDEPSEPGQ